MALVVLDLFVVLCEDVPWYLVVEAVHVFVKNGVVVLVQNGVVVFLQEGVVAEQKPQYLRHPLEEAVCKTKLIQILTA